MRWLFWDISLPSSWSVFFPNKVIFLTSVPRRRYTGLLCSLLVGKLCHPDKDNRKQPVSESEKSWWANNSCRFNDQSGLSGTQDAGFPTVCPSRFLTQKQAAVYCKDIGTEESGSKTAGDWWEVYSHLGWTFHNHHWLCNHFTGQII